MDETELHHRIMSDKDEIEKHLTAAASLMNELAKENITVRFSIGNDTSNDIKLQELSITRRYW